MNDNSDMPRGNYLTLISRDPPIWRMNIGTVFIAPTLGALAGFTLVDADLLSRWLVVSGVFGIFLGIRVRANCE